MNDTADHYEEIPRADDTSRPESENRRDSTETLQRMQALEDAARVAITWTPGDN